MEIIKTLRESWEKNWPELRCACSGGIPEFVTARQPDPLGTSVPVFHYHVIEAATIEADLDFLSRNGYSTIGADALLGHISGRASAPRGSVVLSFDDGPLNLYNVVFPILRSYGMKAVAFLATNFHQHEAGLPLDNQCKLPCT